MCRAHNFSGVHAHTVQGATKHFLECEYAVAVGQKSGTLSVNIRNLLLPAGTPMLRFKAAGGNGQQAQSGGNKPYIHPLADQPAIHMVRNARCGR